MKGSAVDRSFSYINLSAQLHFNQQREQSHFKNFLENGPSVHHQHQQVFSADYKYDSQPAFSGGKNLLEILLSPEFESVQSAPQDDAKIFRKKKKKTGQQTDQEQSKGISR